MLGKGCLSANVHYYLASCVDNHSILLYMMQDDEDENEGEEEEGNGGLSKSGKELKKLLGKANGLNESDAEDDDDDDDVSTFYKSF